MRATMSCSVRSRAAHRRCVRWTCGWHGQGTIVAPPSPVTRMLCSSAGCCMQQGMRIHHAADSFGSRAVSEAGQPTCTKRCATSGHVIVPICRSLQGGAGMCMGEVGECMAQRIARDRTSLGGHAALPVHTGGNTAKPAQPRSISSPAMQHNQPSHGPRDPGRPGSTTEPHLMPSLWLQKWRISDRSRTSTTRCACGVYEVRVGFEWDILWEGWGGRRVRGMLARRWVGGWGAWPAEHVHARRRA